MGGGKKDEGEKSPAGKLLPPVPSERKTGTNREGPATVTAASKQRGLVTGGAIFCHHCHRGRPALRKERSRDCEAAGRG